MGLFDDQFKSRKENNQKAFERSFSELIGIKGDDDISTRDNFLVSQVAHFFDIHNYHVPDKINGIGNKISYLINNNGILGSKIELKDNWRVNNRTPILAFFADNDYPVILLPKRRGTYYCVSYKTGEKYVINQTIAKRLKEEAYVFYKPLPTHKLTLKEYFQYFSKSIRVVDLILVIIMMLVATGIGMLLPYIMKMMTGEVVTNKNLNLFGIVTIYLVSAGITYILIQAFQSYVNSKVSIKIEKMMQETTMARLLSLPTSFFKKYSTGNLTSRFNSVSSLAGLIFNGIFLTLLSSLMSLAYMTQIIQFSPRLVLPVVLILLLTVSFSAIVSVVQIKVSRKQLKLSAKENGTSYAMISGIQKIRLAGAEKRSFARWAKDYSESSIPLYNPPLIIRLSTVISVLITLAGDIAIYYIAAKSRIDVSSFMAFSSSFASLTIAATALSSIATSFSRVRPVIDMVRPLLEEETEDDDSKQLVESLDGNIKIENVSFSYGEDSRKILDNINIDIKEGDYVAIVGKTGCGKSTLVRLLLGFEKPTNGHIYYDDKDIEDLNLQSLRSKIGSVTQNGGVFHADIMSNILITNLTLSEKDAWEAAEIAGIAEDIRKMPMGMRTVISEGQGGISGGQKQRIMIARAIVNKPKILIFDEATSALDNKTQKNISDAITQLNCTRIVIAHRLSTIRNCNHILYMEDGAIKESGTYEELIEKHGKFYELVERQRIN